MKPAIINAVEEAWRLHCENQELDERDQLHDQVDYFLGAMAMAKALGYSDEAAKSARWMINMMSCRLITDLKPLGEGVE